MTQLPEAVSVYTMAGSDDLLVHVTAQDIDHLHALLPDQFPNRREIVAFRTSISCQHLTNPVLGPLPPAEQVRTGSVRAVRPDRPIGLMP
ncbi:Lrp/AsnC ligand binding domain-containing protein [Streptomyces sp. NPDC102365]|uniref:Lrp/AsnC ligand binding domain-containing protein n=1 Tax=Streptomyces sp. NPDC102365 TaxID=3366162 RepID=UPI00382713D0